MSLSKESTHWVGKSLLEYASQNWFEVPNFKFLDSPGNLERSPFFGTQEELVEHVVAYMIVDECFCIGEKVVSIGSPLSTNVYRPKQLDAGALRELVFTHAT